MKKKRLMIFGLAILSLSLTALLFTSSKVETASGTLLANMEAIAGIYVSDPGFGGGGGSTGGGVSSQTCYSHVYVYGDPACDWYFEDPHPELRWDCPGSATTWGIQCGDCYTAGIIGGTKSYCR